MSAPKEKHRTGTRNRLLKAAAEIFAEKGFRETTIADICAKAQANVAAVNYHFRSKENLYIDAWRYIFTQSIRKHPPDGGVDANALPEERLQGQITALLRRISDEENREFWFMQREIANPTGLLEEVLKEELEPLRQRTSSLLQELLGPHVTDQEVRFCEVSMLSQCINPMVIQNRMSNNHPSAITDIDAYTRHVLAFSLAGIRTIRASAEVQLRENISHAPKNEDSQ